MTSIAEYIWQTKYRYDEPGAVPDALIDDTWRRVAAAVAKCERDQGLWRDAFYEEMASLRFLPGGRIIAGAGTGRRVTLLNCFAAGELDDSLERIFDSLKEAALTMQQGGGVGCDFSHLRPSGSPAVLSGITSSGPVSFMRIWDSMCATLLSTSARRGAMMATLRCDHPDIEQFIAAKHRGNTLKNFNLSVLITDRFMQAVADDADWPLVFPPPGSGKASVSGPDIYRNVPAKTLWRSIAEAAHASAEPGVLFIDRVNRDNNLYYCESISATNPCGEIPLPPYGACDLGSLNLTRFVEHPFTAVAGIDESAINSTVKVGVRFLDDVIEVSGFPLPRQAERSRLTRRIGLGITGLADALIMLGHRYDSNKGREWAQHVMRLIRDAAYECSIRLAAEKGPFPIFDKNRYLEAPFVTRLPRSIRDGIDRHGIRNSHLLAIAPTGTISLLADNVSSGIEPVFALDATRKVNDATGRSQIVAVTDFAYANWLEAHDSAADLPDAFVSSETLSSHAHLEMQACLQPYVDNAISKTVNLPSNAAINDVLELYTRAYEVGVKGCTVYRSGSLAGQILRSRDEARCCDVERDIA